MDFIEIVSLIAGIFSIPASIISVIAYFKIKSEKKEIINIKQQIISSQDKYNIEKIDTFDNRKQY